MKRYLPKTYNNRRFLRIIVRTVITVSLAAVIIFVALFFWLGKYIVFEEDGTQRLEIPWLRSSEVESETPLTEDEPSSPNP